MNVSKGDLGAGYLIGTGVALLGSLAGYVWSSYESLGTLVVTVGATAILFAILIYLGYLLLEMDFTGSFVWTVAQWTSVGLGLTLLLVLLVLAVRSFFDSTHLVPGLFILVTATGGVVGALFGIVAGLRENLHRIRELNQRNTVMNRVLRHNIRNIMTVILGHTEHLKENGSPPTAVRTIEEKAREVVRLSETARAIDNLSEDSTDGPIDIVELLDHSLDSLRETYPDASITVDAPAQAWAAVDAIVEAALSNVIENAIEHNDGPREPEVNITVRTPEGDADTVELRVADNGPGIPAAQRDVLFMDGEEPIRHGNGLGLWLVKWFVDHCDGELRFEDNDPHGTVVCLRLPAAEGPADHQLESHARVEEAVATGTDR